LEGTTIVADTSITLYRGAAATSNTTLYTSPSNIAVAITNIAIVNDTSSAATATINLATIPLVSSISLPANSTQFIDLEQIIYNGETITGSASTTAVDFHIAGYEVY
jgi:hypothetical protein